MNDYATHRLKCAPHAITSWSGFYHVRLGVGCGLSLWDSCLSLSLSLCYKLVRSNDLPNCPNESFICLNGLLIRLYGSYICSNELLIRPNESFNWSNESFICSNDLLIRPDESFIYSNNWLIRLNESFNCLNDLLIRPNEEIFLIGLYAAVLICP